MILIKEALDLSNTIVVIPEPNNELSSFLSFGYRPHRFLRHVSAARSELSLIDSDAHVVSRHIEILIDTY